MLSHTKLGYLLEHTNLPHLNPYEYLIVLSGQALLVTPSLMCSFAANYHLNFPRPAPIWPCSSIGRATVSCSGGRGFESLRGQRFLSHSPCWPISFLGLLLRRYYLGFGIRSLQLTTFKPLYTPVNTLRKTIVPF